MKPPIAPHAVRMTALISLLLVAAIGAWMLVRTGTREAQVPGVISAPREDPAGIPAEAVLPTGPAARSGTPLEPGAGTGHVALPGSPAGAPAGVTGEAPARGAFVVTGRVVDQNGEPVAGAALFAVAASALGDPLARPAHAEASTPGAAVLAGASTASTAADGRFQLLARIEAAPGSAAPPFAGTAIPDSLLLVRQPGFAIAVLPCRATEGTAPGFDAGTIVLPPGSTATALVLDESGTPIADAVLQLSATDRRPVDPVPGRRELERLALLGITDAHGRVRIDGFPAGAAELDCLHDDFVPVTLPALLVAGRSTDLGEVVMARGGTIAGTVTDNEGRPLSGATVLVRVGELAGSSPDEDPVLSNLLIRTFVRGAHDVRTRTGESGEFRAGTLNHARYTVFADAPGHEPVSAVDVPVGTEELRLALPRAAQLLLTIVDRASGAPLTELHATAQRCRPAGDGTTMSYGPYLPLLTGAAAASAAGIPDDVGDGAASLLLVEHPGAEGTQVLVSAPGHASATFVLPGVLPADRLEVTLGLDTGIVLEGRVLEPSGLPISGARVLLVSSGSGSAAQRASRSAVTGAAGTFRIDTLAAGSWTAVAAAGGRVESPAQSVDLEPGRLPAPLVFVLPLGGYLAGSVRTASGDVPPPGLRIRVIAPSGEAVAVHVGSSFGSDTATSIGLDGEGRWTCGRALAPGAYRVTVIRAWPERDGEEVPLVSTTVQIVGGASQDLPLILDA